MRPTYSLLAEIGIDLVVAYAALRLRPFDALVARLGTAHRRPIAPREAAMVARALNAWDRRTPFRTRCFEQGLAAMRYLARHGYAGTLHYGARGAGPDLKAHVWVTSGAVDVVGHEIAGDYRVLATYPPQDVDPRPFMEGSGLGK